MKEQRRKREKWSGGYEKEKFSNYERKIEGKIKED